MLGPDYERLVLVGDEVENGQVVAKGLNGKADAVSPYRGVVTESTVDTVVITFHW